MIKDKEMFAYYLAMLLFFLLCGTGAAVEGYFDKKQEIEMAKVRCAK